MSERLFSKCFLPNAHAMTKNHWDLNLVGAYLQGICGPMVPLGRSIAGVILQIHVRDVRKKVEGRVST